MRGRSCVVARRCLCLNSGGSTVNCVEVVDAEFNAFVNMFIFLFCGVHFLLLFLLSSVQVAGHVDVSALEEEGLSVVGTEVLSLQYETHEFGGDGEELVGVGEVEELAGAVELVQPDLHLWSIILKYIY